MTPRYHATYGEKAVCVGFQEESVRQNVEAAKSIEVGEVMYPETSTTFEQEKDHDATTRVECQISSLKCFKKRFEYGCDFGV
jgi:hypothetical protein